MISLVKRLVFNLLVNDFTGKLICKLYNRKIPNIRMSNHAVQFPEGATTYRMAASIFWGFYESAEVRLIGKYVKANANVVELGGSIGIVSSHIISRLSNQSKMVVVEANQKLIPAILNNLKLFNAAGSVSAQVLHNAISYDSSSIFLYTADNNNTSSSINSEGKGVEVNCLSLNSILETNAIDTFTLVCDIEGAEVSVIVNDEAALAKCGVLIMEVHHTEYKGLTYSQDDIIELLKTKGFNLLERDGHVVAMQNLNLN